LHPTPYFGARLSNAATKNHLLAKAAMLWCQNICEIDPQLEVVLMSCAYAINDTFLTKYALTL
jgi:hypothetical protein